MSWKQFLFVPRLQLWQATRQGDTFTVTDEQPPPPRLALIGARACELHAIAIQDRIFLHGGFVDPDYAARRDGALVIAVNCGQAGGTCFCVSMQTGPRVTRGFDLVLTELLDGGHRFLVESRQRAWCGAASAGGRRAGSGGRPRRRRPDRRRAPPSPWGGSSTRLTSRTCCIGAPSTRAGTRWPRVASRVPTARWSARRASARRWKMSPTSPASTPNAGGAGTPASRSSSRTFTVAGARLGQVTLPAVAHAQAGHAGSTSSARPAVSAADAVSPGARSASISPRKSAPPRHR